MSITHVTSASHFQKLLDSNNYVVTDFYADWCGPCKAIAPVFEGLARSETKQGRIVFAKVDVDSQQEVSRKYGVSAMPTFIIFHSSRPSTTLRGADPSGLKSAVLKASADAARNPPRESPAFSSKGHVLGSGPSEPASTSTATSSAASGSKTATTATSSKSQSIPIPKVSAATRAGAGGRTLGSGSGSGSGSSFMPRSIVGAAGNLIDSTVNFFGLYFTSLFSLDPWAAAQGSRWNLTGVR